MEKHEEPANCEHLLDSGPEDMSVPAKKAPLCDGSSQRQLSAEAQRFAKELTLSRCKKPEIRILSISPS